MGIHKTKILLRIMGIILLKRILITYSDLVQAGIFIVALVMKWSYKVAQNNKRIIRHKSITQSALTI